MSERKSLESSVNLDLQKGNRQNSRVDEVRKNFAVGVYRTVTTANPGRKPRFKTGAKN